MPVRRAAASKLKGNIPILARPPSGARGGGHAVPSQGKETSPVDLLSGFELSGGGETNGGGSEKGSENTAVSTPASLPAAAATDMFASFAVPPVVTPSTAASGMPATSAAQGAELQQPDAASAVEYGERGCFPSEECRRLEATLYILEVHDLALCLLE